MARKWSRFEQAVLLSLYRVETRQVAILKGLGELLNEGPNDQGLAGEIKALARDLNAATDPLQKAVEAND